MFLWVESEFSIYFLAYITMHQVSVSRIPVTETDAFRAVPYCPPVMLFSLSPFSGGEKTAIVDLYWEQPKVSHLSTPSQIQLS